MSNIMNPLSIITYMRKLCDRYAKDTGWNFTLLATPAENTAGRFLTLDKERYGVIDGVTDKDYYTNSFHIPVGFECSIAKKIYFEAPFHALCNAGHITYVEVDGDMANNPQAMESIVKHMANAGIGYGCNKPSRDYDRYAVIMESSVTLALNVVGQKPMAESFNVSDVSRDT
jgi:ribonucleoside-triphosphate reductase